MTSQVLKNGTTKVLGWSKYEALPPQLLAYFFIWLPQSRLCVTYFRLKFFGRDN